MVSELAYLDSHFLKFAGKKLDREQIASSETIGSKSIFRNKLREGFKMQKVKLTWFELSRYIPMSSRNFIYSFYSSIQVSWGNDSFRLPAVVLKTNAASL